MHVANFNERTPAAAFIAHQEPLVRAAAANAEAVSQFIHPACVAAVEIARKWLVAPIARQYARRQLHSQLMAMDDRILADIGITRDAIGAVVKDAFPGDAETREPSPTIAPVQPVPAADPRNDAEHTLAA